jgi:hypothetical protein
MKHLTSSKAYLTTPWIFSADRAPAAAPRPDFLAVAAWIDHRNADRREIKVKVRRLDTVLLEHAPDIREIDIVCIHVEGWELEVLNGLSFETYRPKVLIVENLFMQKSYFDYMEGRGYRLWRHIDPNDIFVRRDLLSEASVSGIPS